MKMKSIAIAITVTGLAVGTALALGGRGAPKKPVSEWTCEDFIGVEDTFKPKVVYWAVAYGQGGKPEAAMIDVDGTEKLVPFLAEECAKKPKESFWQKVKDEVKKLEKKL